MLDTITVHLVQIQLALRFGLMALAGVAVFWSVEDILTYVKARRVWKELNSRQEENVAPPQAPLFVGKGLMGLAVFFFSPALLNRALALEWGDNAIDACTIVAMLFTLAFFVSMNMSRLVYYGSGAREALWRTLPVLLATAILVAVGAFVDVAVG